MATGAVARAKGQRQCLGALIPTTLHLDAQMAGTGDLLARESAEPSKGRKNPPAPQEVTRGNHRWVAKKSCLCAEPAGREKPGRQCRQGVSACLTLSPFSSHNLAPASPAPAVGLGAVRVPKPGSSGRARRGSALKWLVIAGTAGSGGSVRRLPNAPALSGAALALREMACE